MRAASGTRLGVAVLSVLFVGVIAVGARGMLHHSAGYPAASRAENCDRWVGPRGNNRASGARDRPWATLKYAAKHVRDAGCTVWFRDGVYKGTQSVERRFSTRVTFRAIHPYRAVFVSNGAALDVGGNAGWITFRGLRLRQSGSGADGVLVYVSGSDDGKPAPDHISFVNNVIHDSWGDDLLKIRSAADHITVRGNVFYNQSASEQHIDVNGVTNVTIEGNIFFNDFGGSGRPDRRDTKQFIVVKDSNGGADGFRGSRRITIERNVFLRWQGGDEGVISIGNDGSGYLEAQHVDIVNNLVIGNGSDHADSALNIYGAGDVRYVNNTVVGDFPTDSFAMSVGIKEANPRNRDILFANNIWSDPTRTMRTFSNGDRGDTVGLTLRRNLYWNGGARVPGGSLIKPRDDPRPVFGNPRINRDQRRISLPYWEGRRFRSGNRTIGQEFVRLVRRYGRIDPNGAAVNRAIASLAPRDDILGRPRRASPDLGAFEA
ncbi:MAG: hypothetical protein WD096_11450 [Actinomycetota bacterium]